MVRKQHDIDRSCRAGGVVQDGDRRVCWGQDREYDRKLEKWSGILCYYSQDSDLQ